MKGKTQPGEKYELKSHADPWFSLNFRRHGVYSLSLRFSLASEHYALPKNSPYAEALKNSSRIEVSSNKLTLTITVARSLCPTFGFERQFQRFHQCKRDAILPPNES